MNGSAIGLYFVCYLLGSIPTGLWLGKSWKGIDVRQHGSGNLGATNVFRVLGAAPGALTLSLDILKGLVSVLLAKHFFPGDLMIAISAGLAAIVGHTMSAFVKFRGGKGVATSAGVFIALLPLPSLFAVLAFAVVFGISHYVSLGSMSGALTLVASAFAMSSPKPLCWMALGISLFVFWTHRSNIQRLRQGTENRIEWSKKAS